MGFFHYTVIDLADMPVARQETTFKELGAQMWRLVTVYNDKAYFMRGPESEDIVLPDYGVSLDGKDDKNYVLKQPTNSRFFETKSSTDGKEEHSHRLRVVIIDDGSVGDFWVEEVLDHTHDIKEVGMLTKASGHTHTFDLNLGLDTEKEDE